MSDIKLSECLFVDLQTDEQRRDWFSLGRGVATGIIAPALQPHLTTAYSKIVESKNLIEQLQQRVQELEIAIGHSLRDMEYAAFNLCESMNSDSENGGRTVETTCPEKSLLIAIRDLKEAMGAG